ncbi:MAG TPA: hypothetical protein VG328_17590 [Stellaceae bacterium]|jgi:hypothetical protein|nr:hypothetical protein [Stellaceae bacterium]
MISKAKVSYTLTVVGVVICIEQYLLLFFLLSGFTSFDNQAPVAFDGLITRSLHAWSLSALGYDFASRCAVPIAIFVLSRSIVLKSVLLAWDSLQTYGLVGLMLYMGEFKPGSLRAPIYKGRVIVDQLTTGIFFVILLLVAGVVIARKLLQRGKRPT